MLDIVYPQVLTMSSLTAATLSPRAWTLATQSSGVFSTRQRDRWFTVAAGQLTKLVRKKLKVTRKTFFLLHFFQGKIPTTSPLRSIAIFGETSMIFTTLGILFSGLSITTARTRMGLVSLLVPATGMILTCWLLAITGCHWTRPGPRWPCGRCLRGTNIKWHEQNIVYVESNICRSFPPSLLSIGGCHLWSVSQSSHHVSRSQNNQARV